mgnify:CR=1 FL=1
MPAGEYNITVDRGSTFKFHVTFYNSSEVVVDLNTYSASMVLLVTLQELVGLQVSVV